jgi:hypothetical protein
MEEPKRLFESGSALERSILGSSRDEAPPDDLERRVLIAMAAAPVVPPPPARLSLPRPRAIVVGLATVALGVVVARGLLRDDSVPPPAPSLGAAPREAPSPAPSSTEPATGTEAVAVRASDLPNAATPTTQVPSALRPRSAVPSSPSSIEREVELLDAVKAKLGAGETAEASTTLDVYDSEFHEGTLRPEATVLRVRTLLARGDRAAAEKIGEDYLSKHATGVHAKRIRALLDK